MARAGPPGLALPDIEAIVAGSPQLDSRQLDRVGARAVAKGLTPGSARLIESPSADGASLANLTSARSQLSRPSSSAPTASDLKTTDDHGGSNATLRGPSPDPDAQKSNLHVPEPASIILLVTGVVGLVARRYLLQRKHA